MAAYVYSMELNKLLPHKDVKQTPRRVLELATRITKLLQFGIIIFANLQNS